MKAETELTRAQLRYQCYAMREQGTCDPEVKPLLDKIENLEHFEGWDKFAMTWDLATKGAEKTLVNPLRLKWKKFSEQKEWEATVNKLASKPITSPRAKAEFKDGPFRNQ